MGETIEDRAKKHLRYFGMDDHVGMVEMLVGFVESALKRPSVSGGGETHREINCPYCGADEPYWDGRKADTDYHDELKKWCEGPDQTFIEHMRSTALKPPVGE